MIPRLNQKCNLILTEPTEWGDVTDTGTICDIPCRVVESKGLSNGRSSNFMSNKSGSNASFDLAIHFGERIVNPMSIIEYNNVRYTVVTEETLTDLKGNVKLQYAELKEM